VNDFHHCKKLATAVDRAIVKPCPDLLYSMANLDFSVPGVRAVKLSMVNPGCYASLSFFTDSTDNFAVANFDADPSAKLWTVAVFGPSENSIDMAKAKKLLGVDQIVRCPSTHASVLQRIFVPTKDMVSELSISQKKATCTPLHELPAGVESVAMKTEASSRFSTPGSGFICASCVVLVAGVLLSEFEGVLSLWKVVAAVVLGVVSVPASLVVLFVPWSQPYLPLAMRNVSLPGWGFNPKCGSSSADSFVRAAIAVTGLLALNKGEAIYCRGAADIDGNPLDCRNDYIITCPKTMPGAWWSITAYGGDHYLVPNEVGVYSFSHQSARKNHDGSITIHWSSKKPEGGDILNWLPAGDNLKDSKVQLFLRLYKPHQILQNATAANADDLAQRFQFPVVKRIR
jgi:hypothetical protein